MSTEPILIPPQHWTRVNVVAQRAVSFGSISPSLRSRFQLAHPPAFEPEAAVLEGIRWLIDQDPLTVANRLIV